VEYDEESFHLGGLDKDLALQHDKPEDELRNVRDIAVAVDELVDRLNENAARIEAVHAVASDVLDVTLDGEPVELEAALAGAVGEDTVHAVDVYDEYPETLPN